MRTFFKNIVVTVVLVLSLFSFETKGQIGSVYPVDLNVMLTPPYGTCLTDLSNSNRFVIQALLRDMNHGNNYEMLIQMRVKSLSSMNTVFLSYSNKFSIGMGKPAVVLGAGNTPVSISNFFERGNVLIGQNILNDNCLPEDAYLFCFQAFDAKAYYAKQRIPISKEFTITAFLENGATPILISPANNDSLSCQLPNVIFQWQQPYITSGINSYTLQVAEANSPFDGPQIIENGGNLLIEKRGLMMPICDIPVTEANFKENHTYYWRVVMCDKEGKARASYPNKGASPVYKFVYCGTPQEPEPEDAWVPQIPMAKSIKKSLDRLRIDTVLSDESSCSAFWFQDPVDVREKYDGVVIEVKKKNQDTWTPFLMESKVATDTLVALSSLAYKETYMARGQYFLYEDGEKVYAPYSDTIEFKIPHPADTLECGNAAPELTDCTNAGERAELEIGDEFNANGTTVSIDTITSQTISGSSVIISGEGHLPFPILSNFGLKVSFDNIEINCADELKKGQVISVYDEKTAAMIDLNNILGKGAAGNDLKQEDASLTEVGPDDDLSGFKSGDLIVEDGKVSLIVGNGNVVQVGTVIDLSNSDAYNDNGALNDEDIYVKFSNPDHENIAFDDDPTGMIRRAATLSDKYVSFGEEYIIPWVATNPGRIFQLTATPSKDLSKSGFTDVMFVLPASGTHVVLDAVENGDGSYSVSIPGMKVDVQNQVYAIARKGEDSPYENVGKLNLCCYSYKSKKVVIVPLLEGLSVNTDEVKKDLDRVYAKLGYTFEVELDDDAAHREGLSTTIGLETDFLSDFSEEMKELIFNYEINIGDAYDKDAAYLFLLDKPTGKYKDAAGIMPQRQQYGFIFMREVTSATPAITHTMAHELGHGIFGLDHIFSGAYGIKKGATYNLMDYTEKTPNDALSYHEWTQINRPLPNWSALSRAEDDMWDPKSSRITSLEDTPFFEFYFDDNQFEKYITYEIGSNNIPVPWCYTPIGMVSGFSITCQKDLLFDKSKITQSKEGFKLQELTLSKEYKLVNEYTLKFIQDNANVGLNRIDIFADDTDHSCSINVIACKKKKYTIKLLVDPSYENFDFNSVVESFNRVFGPLNVEANFTMQELDINFELVDIEKDGVLHKETESKLLKNQIKTEENTYYILFINRRIVNNSMFTPQTEEQRESDNKQNDSDLNSEKLVGGFAVRNRQYPEMNNDPIAVVSLVKNDYHETVVHESGHLIFGLYDVYKDSYNTFNEVFQIGDDITNIMDYVEGSIGGEMHRFLKAYQVLQIEQIDEEFINIK